MLKWIQDEYEAEVVALTINLGQPGEDYDVVEGKAIQLGAVAAEVIDAREEFARDFIVPAIKANAIYGLAYPLFTALGRPLIAKLAVDYARKHGCDTIAHGCTGKGNDQVRIEATVATLAPELKVIAPVRGWQMGREEEIEYAREHGIPVKGGAETTPYSIDDNLWGRSSEGKWIEELDHAPDDDVFQLVTRPEEAPDEPRDRRDRVRARRAGRARTASGSGSSTCSSASPRSAAATASASSTTSRTASSASRCATSTRSRPRRSCCPRTPSSSGSSCTIHQNQFKPELDRQWAYLVYAGLWWEPLRANLDAYMDSVNERVTGTIGMKLYKGSARVVTRASPNAVYDAALATFETSGGLFSQQASPGFIELWSLQSRMAYRLRPRRRGRSRSCRVRALPGDRIRDLPLRGAASCAGARPRSSATSPRRPSPRSRSPPRRRPLAATTTVPSRFLHVAPRIADRSAAPYDPRGRVSTKRRVAVVTLPRASVATSSTRAGTRRRCLRSRSPREVSRKTARLAFPAPTLSVSSPIARFVRVSCSRSVASIVQRLAAVRGQRTGAAQRSRLATIAELEPTLAGGVGR